MKGKTSPLAPTPTPCLNRNPDAKGFYDLFPLCNKAINGSHKTINETTADKKGSRRFILYNIKHCWSGSMRGKAKVSPSFFPLFFFLSFFKWENHERTARKYGACYEAKLLSHLKGVCLLSCSSCQSNLYTLRTGTQGSQFLVCRFGEILSGLFSFLPFLSSPPHYWQGIYALSHTHRPLLS